MTKKTKYARYVRVYNQYVTPRKQKKLLGLSGVTVWVGKKQGQRDVQCPPEDPAAIENTASSGPFGFNCPGGNKMKKLKYLTVLLPTVSKKKKLVIAELEVYELK